jgi:hypothetical protein
VFSNGWPAIYSVHFSLTPDPLSREVHGSLTDQLVSAATNRVQMGKTAARTRAKVYCPHPPNPSAAEHSLDTNKLPSALKCTRIAAPVTTTSAGIFDFRQRSTRSIASHEARSFPQHATALMTPINRKKLFIGTPGRPITANDED